MIYARSLLTTAKIGKILVKRNKRVTYPNGKTVSVATDLLGKLNLNYLKFTNKSIYAGLFDLPSLACNTEILPDYIALYTQPGAYHKTMLTAVGFWLYDNTFEDYDGLYNAIYYNVKNRLEFYKERFKDVKIFFTPDYSQSGDMDLIEQLNRLKMARVVGLWLVEELGAVVIPFITAALPDVLPIALNGLEDCSVVAFSTMGYVDSAIERMVLKELVRLTVDSLNLRTIIVFDVCQGMEAVDDIFSYARERGIEIVVPTNALKERNVIHAGERALKKSKKAATLKEGGEANALV